MHVVSMRDTCRPVMNIDSVFLPSLNDVFGIRRVEVTVDKIDKMGIYQDNNYYG